MTCSLLVGVFTFSVLGCAGEVTSLPSVARLDMPKLQRDLCDRAGMPGDVPVHGDMFPCSQAKWVVWVSPTGSVGQAAIGVYDTTGRLLSWAETDPIIACQGLNIRGVGECVYVLESASGTGLRIRTTTLLSIDSLVPWLSLDTDIWEEGIEGRNLGRRVEHALVLTDLDKDGDEDIIDIEIARYGVELNQLLLDPPTTSSREFVFDHTENRFVAARGNSSHPASYKLLTSPATTAVGHTRGNGEFFISRAR